MNPFQRWLIKHRIWCEYSTSHTICTNYATRVAKIHGRDTVLCQEHAERFSHRNVGIIERGLRERGRLEAK